MLKAKKVTFIIIITFLTLKSFSQTTEIQFTGTTWINNIVSITCVDTLFFKTDTTLTYYSCEESWHYCGTYTINGNSVSIYLDESNEKSNKSTEFDQKCKWILKIQDSELKFIYIGLEHINGYKEVSKEIYEIIGTYKKI